LIGEGGMGTVYEAEQDNPRRTVALKIVRPGLMSRSLLRRFEHEAQMLGRLQHHGIASIYDAGTDVTDEGEQPYFAMEFVNGPTITAFAAEHKLGTRQRLELLANVCDAVEHAHQKGVVHRDLKLGNILVEGNDAPQPKVLDFGIARAIDSDIQTTTQQTDVGQLIGTIAYMSPEQLAGDSSQIDTRSDVYALGVIGYELLSGVPPFDVRGKTIPDAVRIISERDAAPLSIFGRGFRGDIDTIIAKAMEKDRARRYQSAAELAADIRRTLRDEPILARPTSATYQLRKFAKRNKVLVGGVIAVIVVLIAGVIGTSIGMFQAQSEARKAGRLNEYLKGMIAFLDPSKTKGHDITLRQVLDDASRRVDSELTDEPEIAAELLQTISVGYEQLGVFDQAALHSKRSLDLLATLLDENDPRLIDPWHHYGLQCFRANDIPMAEQSLRRALDLNRRRAGGADSGVLATIRELGHPLQLQGKHGEIEPLIAEAMEASKRLPSEPRKAAQCLHTLGDILATQHRVVEAEATYQRALDMYRQIRSDPVPGDYLVLLRDYATMLKLFQRCPEAEALGREAVELSLQQYGDEHEQTILSMNNLLTSLRAQEKLDEAEVLARSLLTVSRKLYGEQTDATTVALMNLATIMRARHAPEPALDMYRQVVELRRMPELSDELELAKALGGEGVSLFDLGRANEAEAPLRECLKIRERNQPANHPSIMMVRNALGAVLVEQGRYADAEPSLVSSWEVLRNVPTSAGQVRGDCLARLVKLYERWNRPEEAERFRSLIAP